MGANLIASIFSLVLAPKAFSVFQCTNTNAKLQIFNGICKAQIDTKFCCKICPIYYDTSHYQNFEPPFEIPDSWDWAQVNDITSSILYGVSESAKSQGEYKLLRITDIQDNSVNWRNVPYTDFDKNKAAQYILQNGDIVFARTGATVGKSYLVESVPSNSIYASYLIRIRTNEEILPEYLKIFFESTFYWQQIFEGAVGIGQPNVNGTSLGLLWLPIPPRNEQRRIVSNTQDFTLIVTK